MNTPDNERTSDDSNENEEYLQAAPNQFTEAELDALLKRRIEEIRSGRVNAIPGEQVMEEMKGLFP